MLKGESLQRQKVDHMELLCWHRILLILTKRCQICACLWEEVTGAGSKPDTKISHRKDTREGCLG